jgi:hypothetical protein
LASLVLSDRSAATGVTFAWRAHDIRRLVFQPPHFRNLNAKLKRRQVIDSAAFDLGCGDRI